MPEIDAALVTRDGNTPDINKINGLLAEVRQNAWTYEAKTQERRRGGDGVPGEMFMGAALVRTADNRFFYGANMHHHRKEGHRACAEASAIDQAVQAGGGREKTEIAEIWFMGGKGDPSKGALILPQEEGRKHTPCGSCRDLIHDLRPYEGEAVVHVLPLNDGSRRLLPSLPGGVMRRYADAPMSLPVSELLPETEIRVRGVGETIRKGYAWLREKDDPQTLLQTAESGPVVYLQNMEQVLGRDSVAMKQAINRYVMEAAKAEYHLEDAPPPEHMTFVLVRTQAGSYHLAKKIKDGYHPATPEAVHEALSAMPRNSKATDVYLADIDLQRQDAICEALAQGKPAVVTMPNGDDRQTIRKFGDRSLSDGPMVHQIVLNDPGQLHAKQESYQFDPARDIISRSLTQLLPQSYCNPKWERALPANEAQARA